MKFKLDENLDPRAAAILRGAGHDTLTVADQHLQGAADANVFEVCQRERRCLVTLDLDFSNLLDFPPETSAGIVILRHPKPRVRSWLALTELLAVALQRDNPTGKLWIVEPGRIRIHQT